MSRRATVDQALLDACSPLAQAAGRVPQTLWPAVLQRAAPHKVANLVVERWASLMRDPPAAVRSARHRATAQNLAFSGRLVELLGVFESEGIQALPFKGPVLAEQVFGALGSRRFGDLDILMPRETLARGCGLLVDLGYQPPGGVALERYLRITLRGGHHVALRHASHGTTVELHWELAGRYLPVALEWATVEPFLERVGFRERDVWNLGPEIGLLYLCVHGAREYWRILDHVVCVAWHLERRPPDWEKLLDLARHWGGERILLTGLGLAAGLFELALPERIALLLDGSPAVRRLVERQSRRIFDADRLATLRLGNLPEFLRMHWTQLGDPVHFARWTARKLTTPVVEDLGPEGVREGALASTTALAPVKAIRRLLGG